VRLVTGSDSGLSGQIHGVLQERLKYSALVLGFGFLLFLALNLFYQLRVETSRDSIGLGLHAGVTLLEGLIAWRLCARCPLCLRRLRLIEVLVFGCPAAWFLWAQWNLELESARRGYIHQVAPAWMLLIFTYALLIPNHWRRALAVIAALALAPVALLAALRLTSPEFAAIIAGGTELRPVMIETALCMLVSAVVAVAGVQMIGRLRTEAFEARQIGQYRLTQRLGGGGMGEVFLAEHLLLKRPCAVKLIRPDKAGDPQSLARFEREVTATARLTHWNSIEIFDYGRTPDGSFYYVMEYLPGMNLEQLVQMHGPLPAGRVVYLLQQVCDALSEAHEHRLVHRDARGPR